MSLKTVLSKMAEAPSIVLNPPSGDMLYRDPEFCEGLNGIAVYNNAQNGNTTIERIARTDDCPTRSTHCIKITNTGCVWPGLGGFTFYTYSRPNIKYVTRIVAKIPEGYTIEWGSNPIGDSGFHNWITPQHGTGKFEEYICAVQCGATGDFATTNFFYIKGVPDVWGTPESPVEWYVAYATVFDATQVAEYTSLPIVVSDESYRYRTLMGEHTLNLKFSLPGYREIPIGTWREFQGQRYTLETPANIKKNATDKFDYDLVMQSDQHKLTKFMLRNTVPGDSRLKFSFTARPWEFLKLLVDNMNASDEDGGWSYGDNHIESAEKVVSFNHNTCAEALQMVAEAFETEWEVKGRTIYLRKVEYNKENPLPLSYGKGNGFLPGLGRSEYSDVKPVERLFVQGGDRNIDASKYRKNDATGQIGSRELLMPANTTIRFDGTHFDDEPEFNASSPDVREYVTDESGASVVRNANANRKSLLEGSLDATSIYPMREGTVSAAEKMTDGWDFWDNTIPDKLDYSASDLRIAGEKATVIFQSGMLAGKEFDIVQTDNALKGYIHNDPKNPADPAKKRGRFKLVSQEIDGIEMPGDVFIPRVGDRYAVFHIGLPQAYIDEAESNLLKEAVKYLYENETPRFTFNGTLDANWAKRDWIHIGGRLVLGGFIRFSDSQFLPDGIDIRITGIKDFVNDPHKPQIELSNNSKTGSWVHSMQRQIASDEVTVETRGREIVQFAKRRFRDVDETMDMLREASLDFSAPTNPITLQTMQIVVGDRISQFSFTNPETGRDILKSGFCFVASDESAFHAPAGRITHKTLGINTLSSSLPTDHPYFWDIPAFRSATLDDASQAYYLYAVVPNKTGGGAGRFELSTSGRPFEDGEMLNLLVGILNSEWGGNRSFGPLYGFSEILPGRMTVGRIVSEDGTAFLDLEGNAMSLGDERSGLSWNKNGDRKLRIRGTLIQSPSGAENALGVFRGAYNAGTLYYRGDEVTHDGSTYRCIKDCPSAGIAPTNTTYWQVVAQKGATGNAGAKGDTGPKGAKGDAGAKGNDGARGADGKDGLDGADGKAGEIIYLRGTGLNRPASAVIKVKDQVVAESTSRGLTLVLLDRSSLTVLAKETYDTWESEAPRNALAERLRALNDSCFVLLVSFDAVNWNNNLADALVNCGSRSKLQSDRCPYAFLGYRGLGRGMALEFQSTEAADAPYAEISTTIVDRMFVGIGTQGADGEKGDKGDPGAKGDPGTNGKDGKNGLDGADGATGPSLVFRGEYKSTDTYYGISRRVDCVKHSNVYYVARPDAGNGFLGVTPPNTSKWNDFGAQFDSIATRLLLAEGANIGDWIIKDGKITSQLSTKDGTPRAQLSGADGKITLTTDINKYNEYGNSAACKQTIIIDSRTGEIRSSTSDYDVAEITSQGIFVNRAGVQALPSYTGIELKAAIAALGFGNLRKDAYLSQGAICGIYASSSNRNSDPAPDWGAYILKLLAKGFYLGSRTLNDNSSSIDRQIQQTDSYIVCYNKRDIDLYLPPKPQVGQTILIRQQNPKWAWANGNGHKIYGENAGEYDRHSVGRGPGDSGLFIFDGNYWNYSILTR